VLRPELLSQMGLGVDALGWGGRVQVEGVPSNIEAILVGVRDDGLVLTDGTVEASLAEVALECV